MTNIVPVHDNVVAPDFRIGHSVDVLRQRIKSMVEAGGQVAKFEMIRDAGDLTLDVGTSRKGKPLARIQVGGLHHEFSESSRVSRHLQTMHAHEVRDRLRSGAFFFLEQDNQMKLVDFVLDAPNRFIHTDLDIHNLMNTIGVSPISHRRDRHLHGNTHNQSLYLGSAFSAEDLSIAELNGQAMGGEFSSLLRFVWNPFQQHVNSAFELIRLICANGAVGIASFLNTKVPLMNQWEQNLHIASKQIQALVQNKVDVRLRRMAAENASVGVLMQLETHMMKRLGNEDVDPQDAQMFRALMNVVDPAAHLGNIYKPEIFDFVNIAAQLPGHLTKMDAWNIATEMNSHTEATNDSTHFALSKIANDLMFTDRDYRVHRKIASPFSSADQAFFGNIAVAA